MDIDLNEYVSVLAVDPGKTTGVVIYENGFLSTAALDYDSVLVLINQLAKHQEPILVIVENYVQRPKVKPEPHALKVMGLCDYIAFSGGGYVMKQTPADAKSYMSDEALRERGMYFDTPHERDAARHFLLAFARSGIRFEVGDSHEITMLD